MSKKKTAEHNSEPVDLPKLHLVFQEADVNVLKQAMELDETLSGDVLLLRDDYAVGPIENIYDSEGYQQRRDWWRTLLELSPYNAEDMMGMVDDRLLVHNLKKRLDENTEEELWIWMGQNQHDVCGYYWLLPQLQNYQGRVVVLYMNNLPFINEKGQIFYPANLHEIQPKEFMKAKKLNRKVTQSEFELDPDEWRRLCSENQMVRILEGGKKISSHPEDFYDKDILANVPKESMKGHRALPQILGKMKVKTGDVFVLWRLHRLAEAGAIEINGQTNKNWKDFDIRIKGVPVAVEEGSAPDENSPATES
ncbi:MAG: DUF1835 domain-containing protein [Flavisolibacter sp.]